MSTDTLFSASPWQSRADSLASLASLHRITSQLSPFMHGVSHVQLLLKSILEKMPSCTVRCSPRAHLMVPGRTKLTPSVPNSAYSTCTFKIEAFFRLRSLKKTLIVELNTRFSPVSFFRVISHRVDAALPQGLDHALTWIPWTPGFLHFSLRDFNHARWRGCPESSGFRPVLAVSDVMWRRLL